MAVASPELASTILQASTLAGARGARTTGLNDLIVALLGNASAATALAEFQVDTNLLGRVAKELGGRLAPPLEAETSVVSPPASAAVERVLARARARVEQTDRAEVEGYDVILALTGERRSKSPLGKGHLEVMDASSRDIDANIIMAAETWMRVS